MTSLASSENECWFPGKPAAAGSQKDWILGFSSGFGKKQETSSAALEAY